ncbi:protein-serine O-palmitoleoyltransferase porcupine [Plutella xylostella]|uniref:protein-serine O-palmitoleoyltransferase porcupine n=1 Tax=Plutella xylostella TaxID=51655 RepID=UPI0020328D6E|nr:protein-serine O-palmitoleoyltransferase porcupine [Plutella xylostella]
MEEDEYYTENSWKNLSLCAEPTLYEGLKFARDIILWNIILRLIVQYINPPLNICHSLSLMIGILLLYLNIGQPIIWTLGITFGSYIFIVTLSLVTTRWRGLLVSLGMVTFLISSEIFIVNPKMWQQIRGIQMIATMKIISVAVELDRGLFKSMLNPIEFAGYLLCPANSLLGPWISFNKYNHYLGVRFLSFRWIKIISINLFLSMLYLVLSNCVVPWYIDDDASKWLLAYRDAQAFRMSHYFVSTMSVVSMISAGFGLSNDCRSEVQVTKPYFIELPRSLVQVVVYWNIPMHKWLKNYVFKPCQPYGQFTAILVTYTMSSVLHGFNFQLSAVLLSIGTFSFVEYNFRVKVAAALEVCCLANPCIKQCNHKYRKGSFLTLFVNFLFGLITVTHLAYLGVMFEASFSLQESGYSYLHTLSKWENLNYFSHGFVAFLYVIFLAL